MAHADQSALSQENRGESHGFAPSHLVCKLCGGGCADADPADSAEYLRWGMYYHVMHVRRDPHGSDPCGYHCHYCYHVAMTFFCDVCDGTAEDLELLRVRFHMKPNDHKAFLAARHQYVDDVREYFRPASRQGPASAPASSQAYSGEGFGSSAAASSQDSATASRDQRRRQRLWELSSRVPSLRSASSQPDSSIGLKSSAPAPGEGSAMSAPAASQDDGGVLPLAWTSKRPRLQFCSPEYAEKLRPK